MRKMTHDEAIAFLSQGTRTGKLATVRSDGRPHVTPVWFVVDGSDIVFNTWHTTAKAKHLRRDPRVAMVVDLDGPPYAHVTVEGSASVSDDLEEVRRFATMIGRRYMGADRAEEFGARNGVEGELLVRVHMDRLIGHGNVSG
jgi:PPOX class probable F420-dependent enzyme